MATVIDSLVITLGMNTNPLTAGIRRAEGIIQSGVKNIAGNILTPLAGAFAFGALIKNFISSATSVGQLSDSLGVNIEEMQAWGAAASHTGGSASALQGTLKNINQQMIDLTTFGTGQAALPLAQLGIAARDNNGKVKDSITILKEMASAADRMDKQRFIGIAKKIGVDDGTLRLLQKGSASVNELLASQKALGVYSKSDSELAEKANIAWQNLMQSLKGASTIFLKLVIPALTWVNEKLTKLVVLAKENEQFLKVLGGTFALVVSSMILPMIVKMTAAMLTNPMFLVFTLLAAAIIGIALVIEDLVVYMQGGETAFGSFWAKFGTGEEIARKLTKAWEVMKKVLSVLLDFGVRFIKYLIDGLTILIPTIIATVKYFYDFFKLLKSILTLDSDGIKNALDGMYESAVKIFNGFTRLFFRFLEFIGLKEPLIAAFTVVKNFFISLFEWIVNKFNEILEIPGKIKDKVSGFFGGIGDAVLNFAGVGSSPIDAVNPSNVNNSRSSNVSTDTKINVGSVTVQTGATDANGIASAIPSAISNAFNQSLLAPINSGVIQK